MFEWRQKRLDKSNDEIKREQNSNWDLNLAAGIVQLKAHLIVLQIKLVMRAQC